VTEQLRARRGFSTLFVIVAVAVVFVLALLAFGVFDFAKLKKTVPTTTEVDEKLNELSAVSTSDEVPDIEKDLNDTNLEMIDAELGEVEKELTGL